MTYLYTYVVDSNIDDSESHVGVPRRHSRGGHLEMNISYSTLRIPSRFLHRSSSDVYLRIVLCTFKDCVHTRLLSAHSQKGLLPLGASGISRRYILFDGQFFEEFVLAREVGGWGRDPFSRNFMKPTPRRKWYLTTGRRFH